MPKNSDPNLVAEPSAEDLARLKAVLARVGGRDVSWGRLTSSTSGSSSIALDWISR